VAVELLQGFAVSQCFHPVDRGGQCAVLGAPVHQRDPGGLAVQGQRPVQRGVAAAQDDQALARKGFGIPHAVVDVRPLPVLGPGARSRRGWNAPRPAANTTAAASKRVPAEVSSGSGPPRTAPARSPSGRDGTPVGRAGFAPSAGRPVPAPRIPAAPGCRRSACPGTTRCTGRRPAASESTTWARMSSNPSSNTANSPAGPAPMMTTSEVIVVSVDIFPDSLGVRRVLRRRLFC
jgi:hypothetical protein